MAVPAACLPASIEPLRHEEMQGIPRTRHRHVEQPPLFLDLRAAAGAEVGRDAAVDTVENVDGFPLLSLGRVDGGEREVILVAGWRAGTVAGRIGRIEGQLRQEPLARREKVIIRMRPGSAPCTTRWATRCTAFWSCPYRLLR